MNVPAADATVLGCDRAKRGADGVPVLLLWLDFGGETRRVALAFDEARRLMVAMTDALDADGPHLAGVVACRVCGHRWAAVAPLVTGLSDGECPRCGAMASEPVEDGEDGR
jgi:rubrerythrin